MKKTFLATSVMLLVACAASGQKLPSGQSVVAGKWVLNETDSQDPLKLIGGGAGGFGTAGRGTTGGGDPMGGTTMTGRAGGRGGVAGGRSSGQLATARAKAEDARQKLEVFTDMHRRLTIEDNGATISIGYAIGPQMTYYVRGKAPTDTVPVLGAVKTHAEWKEGQLVVKHKIGSFEITEEFTRNIGSKRLMVYTTVKGLSRPLQYRRVYDPQ